jgi:hypothetical protein
MTKRFNIVLVLLSGIVFAVNINAEQVGDMNADGQVDTTEAIISLKVAAGLDPGVTLGTYISATGSAVAADVLLGKTFSNSSAANITGTMSPPLPTRALGCLPDINIWDLGQCQWDCDAIASYVGFNPGFIQDCQFSCESLENLLHYSTPEIMAAMLCSVPDPT